MLVIYFLDIMNRIVWKTAESLTSHTQRSQKFAPLIRQVITSELLNETENVIDVFDFDRLDSRISELLEVFPEPHITHALAVKAQPLTSVLAYVTRKFPQLGLECASIQEALHAKRNTSAKTVVYDSPVKSREELTTAMQEGFYINLDNSDEMAEVQCLMEEGLPPTDNCMFGVRLNPLVGAGSIITSSTAGVSSKFGLVYCEDTFPDILALFQQYPWLCGVHCHIGSQGCSPQLLAEGARTIFEAAEKINAELGRQQVTVIDIGGGFPTSYVTDEDSQFIDYRNALDTFAPSLLLGKYRIITEFGRSVFTKVGSTLVRVSNVKRSDPESKVHKCKLKPP